MLCLIISTKNIFYKVCALGTVSDISTKIIFVKNVVSNIKIIAKVRLSYPILLNIAGGVLHDIALINKKYIFFNYYQSKVGHSQERLLKRL